MAWSQKGEKKKGVLSMIDASETEPKPPMGSPLHFSINIFTLRNVHALKEKSLFQIGLGAAERLKDGLGEKDPNPNPNPKP